MTPTAEELDYIKSRSMERTFTAWSPDQQAVYLAVYRGYTDPPAIALHLKWTAEKTAEVLESVYGDLLWDKKVPNAYIALRD